jgi:flagellin-like hook-associated protein FlgL
MGDVILSSAIRASVAQMRIMREQIDATQNRLATGKRVNSPLDNPASFFAASMLRNRASDLTSVLASMGSAQSTVTAANQGIAAIEALLNSARSLAAEALESGEDLVTVTATNSSALTAGSQIATSSGSATRFKAGDVVTVSDGTTTATYTAVNNDDVQDFLDAINNTANLNINASLNASGQTVLAAETNVSIIIGATTTGSGTLSSVLSLNTGTNAYITDSLRAGAASQFSSLRTQIDQAVNDASFNGVNLLSGDTLAVTFNEDGSSSLTMTGGDLTASGLGVAAATNTFQLDSDIEAAIDDIDAALSTLQVQSAMWASNSSIMDARADFTEGLIDTLTTGADDLVLADINEEGAMLLALKARQEMTALGLSITQASETSALRLFGLTG